MSRFFSKKGLAKLVASAGGAVAALQLTSGGVLAGQHIDPIVPGLGFATNIGRVINGVLSFVMVIAALLVFLYLIMGGIEWITSGGDKTKTESARNKITAAIIGLVVLAASYAILLIVLNFLGFSGLDQVLENVGSKSLSDPE